MLDLHRDNSYPATAFHGLDSFSRKSPEWQLPWLSRKEEDSGLEAILTRYIDAWAVADTMEIAHWAAPDYRFVDPLVGSFDRTSLPDYTATLYRRLGFVTLPKHPCGISLNRFPSQSLGARRIRYWRAIPELGLEGTSEITMTGWRVSKEVVCYAMNMSAELLRARP